MWEGVIHTLLHHVNTGKCSSEREMMFSKPAAMTGTQLTPRTPPPLPPPPPPSYLACTSMTTRAPQVERSMALSWPRTRLTILLSSEVHLSP